MSKKAIVAVEKFAEWFVAKMGLELAPSKGIRATFNIVDEIEKIGELEFCSIYRDDNKISLDVRNWILILDKYLEYKGITGYVVSVCNGEDHHFGMHMVIYVGGNNWSYGGVYFLEDK